MVNDLPREQDDVVAVRFFPKGTSDEIVINSDRDGTQCLISGPGDGLADIMSR